MQLRMVGALAAASTMAPAAHATPIAANAQPPCAIHVYLADGPHSVGEDFDAVKRVDQDLRHYYAMAGRSLNWLTPSRQAEILSEVRFGDALHFSEESRVVHPEPVGRREAVAPGPKTIAPGCISEVLLPQIILERGGLATRSLRVFGVIRRYENGQQVASFSSFASAPMAGFELRSPADADAATGIVERAYQGAVEKLLQDFTKSRRK